jgi:DNA invertase Pin-like site-specific DNA recombinase
MHSIEELAVLRHPLPEPGTVSPADCYDDACAQILEQRQQDALRLQAAGDGLGTDPLLLALEDLKAQKEAVDAQIRRLLAYGREFHGSRPYELKELAYHAGYSVSGVRTAYGEQEIRQVAAQIGREPNRPRRDPAQEER